MKEKIRILVTTLAAMAMIGGVVSNAWATPLIWGIHPVTGEIVRSDPRTGTILGTFAPPLTLSQGDTRIGLSIAESGQTLLYQLGNNGPETEVVPERYTLFRLDPFTGAIKSEELGGGGAFGPNGISYQSDGTSDFIFYSHANPIADIHRQNGFSGYEENFWGPSGPPDHFISGALGGDGNGREFGVFDDIFDVFSGDTFIGEYDPFINDPNFINTFAAPAFDITGLAFDGRHLYASSVSGQLFTLNPDTGTVIRSVSFPPLFFPDGSSAPYAFDIAAVPEPASIALLVMGLYGWFLVGKVRSKLSV